MFASILLALCLTQYHDHRDYVPASAIDLPVVQGAKIKATVSDGLQRDQQSLDSIVSGLAGHCSGLLVCGPQFTGQQLSEIQLAGPNSSPTPAHPSTRIIAELFSDGTFPILDLHAGQVIFWDWRSLSYRDASGRPVAKYQHWEAGRVSREWVESVAWRLPSH